MHEHTNTGPFRHKDIQSQSIIKGKSYNPIIKRRTESHAQLACLLPVWQKAQSATQNSAVKHSSHRPPRIEDHSILSWTHELYWLPEYKKCRLPKQLHSKRRKCWVSSKKKGWKHEWSQWKACEKLVLGLMRLYSCGYSSSNRFLVHDQW